MQNRKQNQKLTTIAMLSALIVVLQIIASFVKFGPVSITLALTPIIVGAALYGIGAGALLGFVFSLVVFISGLLGWDGGFVLMMMEFNPFATVLLCFAKGTLAGLAAGAVFRALEKKNALVAVTTAGITAPVVNTGTFALGMLTVFQKFLIGITPAESALPAYAFLFLSMIGVNFLIELGTNLLLATAVTRIVGIARKKL